MPFPRNTAVIAMLVFVVGLVTPLRTFAQGLLLQDDGKPKEVMRKQSRIDFAYHISEAYLSAGTGFDMMTTAHNLSHPTTAYSVGGVYLTHYYAEEQGWARIVGPRDTRGVILANVGLNLGLDLLSRKLYKRGGKWKVAALSINLLKGTDNMVCGFHNMRESNGVDQVVRNETGYRGIVLWSK